MRIEKPLKEFDIYIAYDLLDDLDYMINLRDAAISTVWHNDGLTDLERSMLREPTPPIMEKPSLEPLKEKMKQTMYEVFQDDDVVKYHFYNNPNIRTPDGGNLQGPMHLHVDGPHEDLGVNHGIKTYGSVYYLSDQFDGGEIFYPELDFSFKPVANSMILHPGKNPYWHGVREISNGWRVNFGMLGNEYYDPADYINYKELRGGYEED